MFKKKERASDLDLAQASLRRPRSPLQDAWLVLLQNKIAIGSGIFLILLILSAVFAPLVAPEGVDEQKLKDLYLEWEGFFEEFRVEWEKTKDEAGRKENYWQGKKDGLRLAMNMLITLLRENRPVGDDWLRRGDGSRK